MSARCIRCRTGSAVECPSAQCRAAVSGIIFKASSAVAQAHTHRHSGIRLDKFQPGFPEWSGCLRRWRSWSCYLIGRQVKPQDGAVPGFAGHVKPARPVSQTRPACWPRHPFPRAGIRRAGPRPLSAMVRRNWSCLKLDAEADFAGAGMAHDIGEGFLEGQKQLVPAPRIHARGRAIRRSPRAAR